MSQALLEALRRFIGERRAGLQGDLVLAWSGGRDSSALAHALLQLRDEMQLSLRAVHIHHGLQADADPWVEHITQQARLWQLPLRVHRVQVGAGPSLEAQARAARQAVWAAELRAKDVLLLAHHAMDQAETVLFRLFRGSGLDGLAAMASDESWHEPAYRIWRPWLDQERKLIEDYLHEQGITWVEDGSNADVQLDRNYIRHRILPAIVQRWPQAIAHLGALAGEGWEERQLRQERDAALLAGLLGEDGRSLDARALGALPISQGRRVLRLWLRQAAIGIPPRAWIERLWRLLFTPAGGAQLYWRHHRFVCARQRLYWEPVRDEVIWPAQVWTDSAELYLPDGGVLRRSLVLGQGLRASLWQQGLEVRQRRGGERLHRHDGERQVKKLLQSTAWSAAARAHMPLLYCGEQLICVPGVATAQEAAAAPGEPGYWVHWQAPELYR